MSKKLESVEDLVALKEKVRTGMDVRSEGKDVEITVYMSTCGIAAGAREVMTALMDSIESFSADNVVLRQAGCLGLCDREPMISLTVKGGEEYLYGKLDPKKAQKIIREHVLDGNPVLDLLVTQTPGEHPATKPHIE